VAGAGEFVFFVAGLAALAVFVMIFFVSFLVVFAALVLLVVVLIFVFVVILIVAYGLRDWWIRRRLGRFLVPLRRRDSGWDLRWGGRLR
jgi:hypothetical protein